MELPSIDVAQRSAREEDSNPSSVVDVEDCKREHDLREDLPELIEIPRWDEPGFADAPSEHRDDPTRMRL